MRRFCISVFGHFENVDEELEEEEIQNVKLVAVEDDCVFC